MNNFLKIVCITIVFSVFIALSTVDVAACDNQGEWQRVSNSKKKQSINISIKECDNVPWKKLIKVYGGKKRLIWSSEDNANDPKIDLLEALFSLNKKELCDLSFVETKLDKHVISHSKSVGAGTDKQKYLKTIKDYMKKVCDDSGDIKYGFSTDFENGYDGLQAIITEPNNDKYCLVLGLNHNNELCIKTFYKFLNTNIANIIANKHEITRKIDKVDGKYAYVDVDNISIKVNNDFGVHVGCEVQLEFTYDENNRPVGSIIRCRGN